MTDPESCPAHGTYYESDCDGCDSAFRAWENRVLRKEGLKA